MNILKQTNVQSQYVFSFNYFISSLLYKQVFLFLLIDSISNCLYATGVLL